MGMGLIHQLRSASILSVKLAAHRRLRVCLSAPHIVRNQQTVLHLAWLNSLHLARRRAQVPVRVEVLNVLKKHRTHRQIR